MASKSLQTVIADLNKGKLSSADRLVKRAQVSSANQSEELKKICAVFLGISAQRSMPGLEEIALAGYKKILKWDPCDIDALVLLSEILMRWGDLITASNYMEKGLVKHPDNVRLNVSHGALLLKQGKNNLAINVFRKCLAVEPDNALCYTNIAIALMNLKQDKLAIECFQKAISLEPKSTIAYINLAILLHRYDYKDQAYKMAEMAAKISPSNPSCYSTTAALLFEDGEILQAEEMARIALSLDPDHNASKEILATSLNIQGKIDESKAIVRDGKNHRQFLPGLMLSKVETGEQALSQEEIEGLKSAIGGDSLSDEGKSIAFLALARSAELDGDCEQEICNLRYANQFKRKKHLYRQGLLSEYQSRIIDKCNSELIANLQGVSLSNLQPIFIMGPPRSGSTLTEQILASHPDVSAIGESGFISDIVQDKKIYQDGFLNADACKGVAQDYEAKVDSSFPDRQKVFTDKSLLNFYHLGLLKLAFPKAKFIITIRNPIDNCLGMFKQLFHDSVLNFSDDFESIVEFYKSFQDVMAYWDSLFSDDIYYSSYESLVEKPEIEARKLIEYCGLRWDDQCLKFYENQRDIRTASVLQVRKPIYKSAVAKWKKYEPYIQDLIELLNKEGIKVSE